MRLLSLFEALDASPGTFVGVKFDQSTIDSLMDWIDSMGLETHEPADELHTTVLLDKEHEFDWEPQSFESPIEVSPETFSLDLFGQDKNVLVLKYQCDELADRHSRGMEEHNLSWDFPEYSPHVTLSYDGSNIDIESLSPPDFPLNISHEYVQPFNQDYA